MTAAEEGGLVARAYHHGALAEAMIEQALEAVRAQGAENVSLRAIAHALGVSPSAAYNHFADKEALLRVVEFRALNNLNERMTQALAAHPGDDDDAVRSRFASLGRAYLSFALDEPQLFRLAFGPLCASDHRNPGESPPYAKLVASLDELQARGLLKPDVREGLDLTLWGATHGVASLIVEGLLPPEAGDALIDSFGRLAFRQSD
jgi:AcrR family transcriptional regulator